MLPRSIQEMLANAHIKCMFAGRASHGSPTLCAIKIRDPNINTVIPKSGPSSPKKSLLRI